MHSLGNFSKLLPKAGSLSREKVGGRCICTQAVSNIMGWEMKLDSKRRYSLETEWALQDLDCRDHGLGSLCWYLAL